MCSASRLVPREAPHTWREGADARLSDARRRFLMRQAHFVFAAFLILAVSMLAACGGNPASPSEEGVVVRGTLVGSSGVGASGAGASALSMRAVSTTVTV